MKSSPGLLEVSDALPLESSLYGSPLGKSPRSPRSPSGVTVKLTNITVNLTEKLTAELTVNITDLTANGVVRSGKNLETWITLFNRPITPRGGSWYLAMRTGAPLY